MTDALPVIGVCVALEVADGRCASARVVVGGLATGPRRSGAAEEALIGVAAGDGDGIAAAMDAAAAEIETQEDLWADSDYRKLLIRSLGARSRPRPSRGRRAKGGERKPAMSTTTITVTINGEVFEETVPVRMLLVDFIRERAGLTGTHIGCTYEGVCGACTVQLDGEAVKSCLMVAAQADGHEITTVEALAKGGKLSPLQRAFNEQHALQCGYCTPGILMNMEEFLRENPDPTDEEIRHGLVGNLCRCTGYAHIVDAVRQAAKETR